jgi:hypothetical protein
MQVIIDEIVSTVHAVEGEALLSPRILERIVQAVLEAVQAQAAHQQRAQAERRVTAGVSHELEESWR